MILKRRGKKPEYASSIIKKVRFQSLLSHLISWAGEKSLEEEIKNEIRRMLGSWVERAEHSWEEKSIEKANEIVCGSPVKTHLITLSS